jgi:hypothetical protein
MLQKRGVITLKNEYLMCIAVKANITGAILMLVGEFHHS